MMGVRRKTPEDKKKDQMKSKDGMMEMGKVPPPPTEKSSAHPSAVPSAAPSAVPSDVPSSTPSDVPTFAPSNAPSSAPVAKLPDKGQMKGMKNEKTGLKGSGVMGA